MLYTVNALLFNPPAFGAGVLTQPRREEWNGASVLLMGSIKKSKLLIGSGAILIFCNRTRLFPTVISAGAEDAARNNLRRNTAVGTLRFYGSSR